MPSTKRSPRTLQLHAYTQFKQTELTVVLTPIGDAFILAGTTIELAIRHRASARIIHKRKVRIQPHPVHSAAHTAGAALRLKPLSYSYV